MFGEFCQYPTGVKQLMGLVMTKVRQYIRNPRFCVCVCWFFFAHVRPGVWSLRPCAQTAASPSARRPRPLPSPPRRIPPGCPV
jgi:hypothetical protein